MTVHMVNLTNPMMMRPSFREIIPSPPQQVRLRLPEGRRVSKVHFLVAGTTPAVQTAGGVMTSDRAIDSGSRSDRDRLRLMGTSAALYQK